MSCRRVRELDTNRPLQCSKQPVNYTTLTLFVSPCWLVWVSQIEISTNSKTLDVFKEQSDRCDHHCWPKGNVWHKLISIRAVKINSTRWINPWSWLIWLTFFTQLNPSERLWWSCCNAFQAGCLSRFPVAHRQLSRRWQVPAFILLLFGGLGHLFYPTVKIKKKKSCWEETGQSLTEGKGRVFCNIFQKTILLKNIKMPIVHITCVCVVWKNK